MSDPAPIPDLVRDFAERNGGRAGGPKAVRMIQKAEMRLSPAGAVIPLRATQISGTREPGFLWEATSRLARVLPMRILDSYVAGTGWLDVRIAGAIRVATARGPGADRGEAMRFLAELAWNPDALLNARGLTWEQRDALSVEVSLETGAGAARVTLLFDAAGDIVGMTAADRPRAVGRVDCRRAGWGGSRTTAATATTGGPGAARSPGICRKASSSTGVARFSTCQGWTGSALRTPSPRLRRPISVGPSYRRR